MNHFRTKVVREFISDAIEKRHPFSGANETLFVDFIGMNEKSLFKSKRKNGTNHWFEIMIIEMFFQAETMEHASAGRPIEKYTCAIGYASPQPQLTGSFFIFTGIIRIKPVLFSNSHIVFQFLCPGFNA